MKEHKHILVVEDDVELNSAVTDALNRAGYKAVGVHNARDALMRMKNQKYDAIFVDIVLGDGSNAESGEDLLFQIRERPDANNQATPVVVISGNLQRELVERIAKSIQGALVKPFEMKALLEAARKAAGEPTA
jgi:DNA-binding response OmpR family regulator